MRISGAYPLRIVTRSPISHGSDERAGNTQLFRRERLLTANGELVDVPVISGNAVRGQLRRIAARAFCESVGARKLPHALYHFFFSGGAIAKGSVQSAHRAGDIQDLRDLIPLVDLFGGAWGGEIIPGALRVLRLVPLCLETSSLLGLPARIAANSLTDMVMYTRRDDETEYAAAGVGTESTIQMIYEVETLIAGLELHGGFRLCGAGGPAAALFTVAVQRWLRAGVLGGMAAKGHGLFAALDQVILPPTAELEEHIDGRRDEIRRWLETQGAVVAAAGSGEGAPPLDQL